MAGSVEMWKTPQRLTRVTILLAGLCLTSCPWGSSFAERVAKIAYVGSDTASRSASTIRAFRERLAELGWREGRNLVLEQYWADGYSNRFPDLMHRAVSGKPDVLVTMSTPGALAAKQATSTVPVVVAAMGDPVQAGVVTNLAHPGGNITALSTGYADDFAAKWLELVLEFVPKAKRVAVIWNLSNPVVLQYRSALEQAATARGVKLNFLDARSPSDLDSAFLQARQTAEAAVVTCENLVIQNVQRVVDLAAKNHLPSVYCLRMFATAGGLVSYGVDLPAMYSRAADYVDKVLKGTDVGSLPVEQPRRFEFVVNMPVAKALGIVVPESVLSRADEVIR